MLGVLDWRCPDVKVHVLGGPVQEASLVHGQECQESRVVAPAYIRLPLPVLCGTGAAV